MLELLKMKTIEISPVHSKIVQWKKKAIEAEVRIESSDITVEKVDSENYPILKPIVLEKQFPVFKDAHVLRLRNLSSAVQESAGSSMEPAKIAEAVRSIQYWSTSAFATYIMKEDPGFLGVEKEEEIIPYAEIYSVVRQTTPHCHGRTVHGSLFSLGYGSGINGVKKSGNLTLWNLEGFEKTDKHFVVDEYQDWYLKRQSLLQIENVDLPPIDPTEQPIVIIHDGVTAHSNTKVELAPPTIPAIKRLISFVEMCFASKLNPAFFAEKFIPPSLINQRREEFINGKIIGILDSCPDT